MKRRILKYLLISLSLLILAGLWAFSTFFFNPFEDKYAYDLASLIPREVDFYVSKARLRRENLIARHASGAWTGMARRIHAIEYRQRAWFTSRRLAGTEIRATPTGSRAEK